MNHFHKMNLSNLKPAEGATHTSKRIGRGVGSGKGRTAARGTKGAKSRSGYSQKIGFEGGQMPLQRRIPKGGFKNINRVSYKALNLDVIQDLINAGKVGTTITPADLVKAKAASKNDKIKLLNRGKLTSAIQLTIHAASQPAIAAVEAAGGKVTIPKKENKTEQTGA